MEVRSETGHYHMYMAVAAPFNDGFHQSRAWGWLRRVVSAIEATPSCPGTLLLLLHRRRAAHSYLLFPEDAFSPQSALDVAAGPLAFPRTHGRPLKSCPSPNHRLPSSQFHASCCSFLGGFQQRQQTSTSRTMRSIILPGLLASLASVQAQTFTDCNPTERECPLPATPSPSLETDADFAQSNAPPNQDSPPRLTPSTSPRARILPTGSTPAPARSISPRLELRLQS